MGSRRPRLWFKVKISGVTWSVYFATLRGLEGLCIFEHARIKLSYHLSRERVEDVLYHELSHAVIFQCGIDKILNETIEETMVSVGGHAMFQMLKDAGFLHFPPLPEWL